MIYLSGTDDQVRNWLAKLRHHGLRGGSMKGENGRILIIDDADVAEWLLLDFRDDLIYPKAPGTGEDAGPV